MHKKITADVHGNSLIMGDWVILPYLMNGDIEFKVTNKITGALWYFATLQDALENIKCN